MRLCIFRVRLNHPSSIWYSVLCALLQGYLLWLALERYRLYTEMQWPHGAFPRIWLTAYIILLASCIPLIALLATFGSLKTGNLAGDNEQLAGRTQRTIELIKGGSGTGPSRRRATKWYRLCHFLKSIWEHGPPVPQTLHLIVAFVQLFAQQIMLAQLYRFGFINSGDFLNTELDFVFQRARQLATNLPMGDTRLQGFRITSDELADSPLAPNLLPILMHARLFGIPLEFVNLVIALIAYASVYPAVFWRLSKPFALLFLLFLSAHSAALVSNYLSFSVLFRIQETNYYSPRPVGIGQHLWALRPLYVLHPIFVLSNFWAAFVLMQLATVVFYAYGYSKYSANLYLHRRRTTLNNGAGSVNNGTGSCSRQLPSGERCDGYAPNIAAIFVLLFIGGAKAPTLYALALLYQNDEKPLLLTCLVIDVGYLFVSMLFWLVLTVKCQWKMRVVHEVHELLSLQDAHHTANGCSAQHRTPAELKNALVLMHGNHLFVTDDPLAKPSLMRQVLKTCGGAQLEDIYWLRQSPRKTTQDDGSGASIRTQTANNNCSNTQSIGSVRNTPETSRLLLMDRQRHHRNSLDNDDDPLPIPYAAPPYQRLTSLPPSVPTGHPGGGHSQQMSSQNAVNTFGTLNRGNRMQIQGQLQQNEYSLSPQQIGLPPTGAAHPQHGQPHQYYGIQQNGTEALSRSCIQPMSTSNTNFYQHYQMMPPESYASISRRRSSKSSAGGAQILPNNNAGGPILFPNNNTKSSTNPLMPISSPQLIRQHRSGSGTVVRPAVSEVPFDTPQNFGQNGAANLYGTVSDYGTGNAYGSFRYANNYGNKRVGILEPNNDYKQQHQQQQQKLQGASSHYAGYESFTRKPVSSDPVVVSGNAVRAPTNLNFSTARKPPVANSTTVTSTSTTMANSMASSSNNSGVWMPQKPGEDITTPTGSAVTLTSRESAASNLTNASAQQQQQQFTTGTTTATNDFNGGLNQASNASGATSYAHHSTFNGTGAADTGTLTRDAATKLSKALASSATRNGPIAGANSQNSAHNHNGGIDGGGTMPPIENGMDNGTVDKWSNSSKKMGQQAGRGQVKFANGTNGAEFATSVV